MVRDVLEDGTAKPAIAATVLIKPMLLMHSPVSIPGENTAVPAGKIRPRAARSASSMKGTPAAASTQTSIRSFVRFDRSIARVIASAHESTEGQHPDAPPSLDVVAAPMTDA